MKTISFNRYSPAEHVSHLKTLYESAFPTEERINFTDLLRLVEQMPLSISLYYQDDIFIGFTIFFERDDFNWFWYFAVEEELRGNGYGQEILSEMLRHHKSAPMIIDVESPFQEDCNNITQRKRRYDFYLRNGFKDTGVGRTFEGITYRILMNGDGNFTLNDYDYILSELRNHWSSMPSPE